MKKTTITFKSIWLVFLLHISKTYTEERCYLTPRPFLLNPRLGLETCRRIYPLICINIKKTLALTSVIGNEGTPLTNTKLPDCIWLIIEDSQIPIFDNKTFTSSVIDRTVYLNLKNTQIKAVKEDALGTFLKLRILSISDNEITTNFFTNLGQLRELTLNNNNITRLSDDDFKNLQFIYKLNLSRNNLQTIGNLTSNFPSLEEFYIANNNISVLESQTFEKNKLLIILDLNSNKLQTIRNDTFENLNKLTDLNLENNLLSYLEDGTFQNLTNLQSLRLNNNKLQVVSQNTFKGLTNLKDLFLKNNKIKCISPESFLDLEKLSFMDLEGNNISKLENRTFTGLKNLPFLNLTSLNIEKIEPGAFSGLSILTVLDLRSNKMYSLEAQTFVGLQTLQELHLGNSSISSIKAHAFQDLTQLKLLNIQGTNVSVLETDVFNGMTSLTFLNMLDSNIKEIKPGAFNGLDNLNTLLLSNRNIRRVSVTELTNGTFQGLNKLKTLSIANLNIKVVSSEAFKGLNALESIILENCTLKQLTYGMFLGLNVLQSVKSYCNEKKFSRYTVGFEGFWYDFGNLSIESIEPETFGELLRKKQFYKRNTLLLNYNKLTTLQTNTFAEVSNIVELQLDNNNLETIEPGAFSALTFHFEPCQMSYQVTNDRRILYTQICNTLFLNNNSLKVLTNYTFDNLENLVVLKLDHNEIEEIESEAFGSLNFQKGMTSLRNESSFFNALYLNNNKLKVLKNNPFSKIKHLKLLRLDYNEIETIEPNAFNGFSFNSVSCPYSLRDVKEIYYNDLYLNNNKLKVLLNNTFKGIKHIAVLRLDNNEITEIKPGAFNDLSFVAQTCDYNTRRYSYRTHTTLNYYNSAVYNIIYLNNNNLNFLSENTFVGIQNLTHLRLDNNCIKNINPGAFSTLNQLILLNLNNNEVDILTVNLFKDLVELQTLDLSNNKIFTLNIESFSGLKDLQHLLLQNNRITEIPLGALKNFPLLKNLQLGNNNLSRFRIGSFSNLENLKYLNISHNNFFTLNVTALYSLINLELLDLDDNYLNFINYTSLLQHVTSLRFLSVNGNKWTCEFLTHMIKKFRTQGINYLFNTTSQYTEENVDGMLCVEINEANANASSSEQENFRTWMKELTETLEEFKNNTASRNVTILLSNLNEKFDKWNSIQQPVEEFKNLLENLRQVTKFQAGKLSTSNELLKIFNESAKFYKKAQDVDLEKEKSVNFIPFITILILLLCISSLTICLVVTMKFCNVRFRKIIQRRLNRGSSHMELIDTTT